MTSSSEIFHDNEFVLREFYVDGIAGLLEILPHSIGSDSLAYIEAVTFAALDGYQHYSSVVKLLDNCTNIKGEFVGSLLQRRQIFSYAWALVDALYLLSRLSNVKKYEFKLNINEETKKLFRDISQARNYKNHIADNLANSSKQKNRASLLGWLTYQVSPNGRTFAETFFTGALSSGPQREKYKLELANHCSLAVIAPIDVLTLHIKNGMYLDLSACFVCFTLDLKVWLDQCYSLLLAETEISSKVEGLSNPCLSFVASHSRDDGMAVEPMSFREALAGMRISLKR